MKIDVQNNIPGVRVNVNQNADGSFTIMLAKEIAGSKTLGSVKPGDTVTIGEREYIVLSHENGITSIVAKKPTKFMAFGKNGNYAKSDVSAYCNGEFYEELCKAVGEYNVLPHTVNLVSDDGSNKGASVTDFVSIPTCDLYRRYRELFPAIGSPCWTATMVTTLDKNYASDVCFVSSRGILSSSDCSLFFGVCPFCYLNSSVLVSLNKDR